MLGFAALDAKALLLVLAPMGSCRAGAIGRTRQESTANQKYNERQRGVVASWLGWQPTTVKRVDSASAK